MFKGKKRYILFALAAIIIVFAVVAARGILHNKELSKQNKLPDNPQNQIRPNTVERNIFSEAHFYQDDSNAKLTFPPVLLDDITSIVPLGFSGSGEGHSESGAGTHQIPSDHMYVRSQSEKKGQTRVFKVYAVADCYLANVCYSKGAWQGPDGTLHALDSYSLEFQISKNLFIKITDLTDLTPELKAQVGSLSEGAQNFRSIPIKSGMILGQSGSGDVLTSVDFWAIDFRQTAQYIHPQWHGDLDSHSANPLSYYDEPLRSQLIAKLPQRGEPRAGQFACDIDGKLLGNWFPLNNPANYPEGLPNSQDKLAFYYWYQDASVIEIAYVPESKVYVVKNNGPDPATIGLSSGMVKYELMDSRNYSPANPTYFENQATMLVQMLENRRIKMELFKGKTSDQVTDFDSSAMEFYR
jgi:hypothetical protein